MPYCVSYDHSRDKPVIESLLESFRRGRTIDDRQVKYLTNWLLWNQFDGTSTTTDDDRLQSTASEIPLSPTTPIPTVPTTPPGAYAQHAQGEPGKGEDAPQACPANTDGSSQQQELANAIAPTARLLWHRQHQGLVARGRRYDLDLVDGDIIKVSRLSGESLAEIPLDANSQPIGIALSLDDVENFRQIQKILAAHQQLQNKDGLEL